MLILNFPIYAETEVIGVAHIQPAPHIDAEAGKAVTIVLPHVQSHAPEQATIRTIGGSSLWQGTNEEVAHFPISGPLAITIDLGAWANPFSGRIAPGKAYTCIPDTGIHWKATFHLVESTN